MVRFFFFFNDTATTEIYTLSLHDALPISSSVARRRATFSISLEASTAVTFAPPRARSNAARPVPVPTSRITRRSEEHTSELQSQSNLVCRLLLEKKKIIKSYA